MTLRFGVVHVIEARKMQETVYEEMARMRGERLLLLFRLARDDAEGERDIAQMPRRLGSRERSRRRKGQNIGRALLAAPGAVELRHRLVVTEQDRRLHRLGAEIDNARAMIGDALRLPLEIVYRQP